jgi:hypothetical protein
MITPRESHGVIVAWSAVTIIIGGLEHVDEEGGSLKSPQQTAHHRSMGGSIYLLSSQKTHVCIDFDQGCQKLKRDFHQ